MIRKALVALDGTPAAERVLPWLKRLAPRAKLVLLRSSLPLFMPGPDGSGVAVPVVQEDALRYLEGVARRMKPRPQIVATAGSPAIAILDEAARRDCDLIAMATRGGDALRRRIFGGTTEKLIHGSRVPILAVPAWRPAPGRGRLRTAAVPVDGSPASEAILRRLVPWAARANVRLELVHALTETEGLDRRAVDKLKRAAEDRFELLAARLRRKGVRARAAVVKGPLPEALLKGAKAAGAELIALSMEGHGAIRHLLKGGLVSRLIQATYVPVLAAPAGR